MDTTEQLKLSLFLEKKQLLHKNQYTIGSEGGSIQSESEAQQVHMSS